MFTLQEQLVGDFRNYLESFLCVRDPAIRSFLHGELDRGALWPEPLLQLNPSFEPGHLVDELVADGRLSGPCGGIFRRNKEPENPFGEPLRLYRHQERALDCAQAGRNFVLTTGTGSGKSLCYILPIVDAILREGSGHGIRALVVYPMNALANSQVGELKKYLGSPDGKPLLTYARYTGQERDDERESIVSRPPDILLTNFMMLELILTRPYESPLAEAMGNLRFVVLDELHTYRGRQGADVAMLARRLRERSGSRRIQFIGTSATMASEGSAAERRERVAKVASRLFGADVSPDDVIAESLQRFSTARDVGSEAFRDRLVRSLEAEPPSDLQAYRDHPLTVWIESVVGLDTDDEGNLVRATPLPLRGPDSASEKLSTEAGISAEEALRHIQRHLQWQRGPEGASAGCPIVFRLHQFLSPGNGVFATLGSGPDRYLSTDGQKADPRDPDRVLLPLCFCRVCGQHYYLVMETTDERGRSVYVPRRLTESPANEADRAGFLYVPAPGERVSLDDVIPENWYEERGSGRLLRSKRAAVPVEVTVDPGGALGGSVHAWFIRQPFPFCMNPECGASYQPRDSDVQKLSVLGMQGRSTATTALAISALHYLRESKELPEEARKILSFTDNRQDASLQAGHLNDFVAVGVVRAALYAAAREAGDGGLAHDQVTLAVEKQLGLQQEDYAIQPSPLPRLIEQHRAALRDVLGYRIYVDLVRGWRVNAPNLEQVGLVRIEYPDLPAICSDERFWQGRHEALLRASAETREAICRALLERLRRGLAIRVDYLDADYQEGLRRRCAQVLKEPWAFSEDEAAGLRKAARAWLAPCEASRDKGDLLLSERSAFCNYLRQLTTWPDRSTRLSPRDAAAVADSLVHVLVDAGLLTEVAFDRGAVAYQLNAEAFVWRATDPAERHDALRNPFFERLYTAGAARLRDVQAREHTAQVDAEDRIQREEAFRRGELPILFCSPTMELGVDIADLNLVNLRNVPPTPANYAQRSGRAGRGGQPALVYTYCTAGSPHDQYYFRRPEAMVAGAVTPPRLEIVNEDLLRAHVHAMWLAEADFDLGHSLADRVLDLTGAEPSLEIQPLLKDRLQDVDIRQRTATAARRLLAPLAAELEQSGWYTPRWLDDVIAQIPLSFDRACDRWRNLYRAARRQAQRSHSVMLDHSASADEKDRAKRIYQESFQQMELLTKGRDVVSDFYVYRYLASEGFLPGYNFPRLPLSAYLPPRRGGGRDGYLSRARFLAISEFGPGAIIYHEGSRYVVERALLPASAREESGHLAAPAAKLCARCGAVLLGEAAETADLCEWCGASLDGESQIHGMLRLEAVSLWRRDRITCDEEERMRQGYDIRTGLRIAGAGSGPPPMMAEAANPDGSSLARLAYAQAATIVRINLGWRRRKENAAAGFHLDLDRGRWLSEKHASQFLREEEETGAVRRAQRVIPYVEDRRNALLIEWAGDPSPQQHASVQAALKSAIQAVYQLEEAELAAEPLPTDRERRSILIYEAAEGGAGVLHHLASDPGALREVARAALEICHYDPDTLEDRRRHPRATEDCSVACYDCLLSYSNQRDHTLLDRRAARDGLAALRDATVTVAPRAVSRGEHLASLLERCGSDLERKWLRFLDERKLNLPTDAQLLIRECGARPDFAYARGAIKLAVYIDGPVHDDPQQRARDAEQESRLLSLGWVVQRFRHDGDWEAQVREFPSVYGGHE